MALPTRSEHEEWPGNPLDAAREAFGWLTAGDHPVAVDGRLFDHLPARIIPVDELRDLLLTHGCPRRGWDQVWTHVISRARVEGGTWTITAVGLALPMLTSLAARLTERYADDPSDIHAEVLRGFLDGLQTVDLTEGRITHPAAVGRLPRRAPGTAGRDGRADPEAAGVPLQRTQASSWPSRSGLGSRGRGRGPDPDRGRADRRDPPGRRRVGRLAAPSRADLRGTAQHSPPGRGPTRCLAYRVRSESWRQ